MPRPCCASASTARWMLDGVTMVDPSRTYIDATVVLEPDVRILPGTILEGRTVRSAAGSVIGPDSHLVDTIVGEANDCRQHGRSRGGESATTARSARSPTCGPAPGSRTAPRRARSSRSRTPTIGEGTKVPHLSYVGDAEIGADANLGASTITANYDGVNKHRTKTRRRGAHQHPHLARRAGRARRRRGDRRGLGGDARRAARTTREGRARA